MNSPHYPPEISKILQLIASNDYENIVLAISIANSIPVDIIKEITPLLKYCKGFEAIEKPSENDIVRFLQSPQLNIQLNQNTSSLKALIFCQNTQELTIDLQEQNWPTEFIGLNIKELSLKNVKTWPLSLDAIHNLAKQDLQTLSISRHFGEKDSFLFQVPKELAQITSLYKLEIEHPNLEAIPEKLVALTKLELITLYGRSNKLNLPDTIFELPLLRYAYIDNIPNNTFPFIAPELKFRIKKPSFKTFWQLCIWKHKHQKHWSEGFSDPLLFFLEKTVRLAILIASPLFSSDTHSKQVYYLRAFLLAISTTILLPFVFLFFITTRFWKLPEWYQQHTHNSFTGRIIRIIADWAIPSPFYLEGLGPMGCFGAMFFMSAFLFIQYIWPLICRLLFLPFAILIGLIGLIIEPFARLLK